MSNSDQPKSIALRTQALALLEQAQTLDGLQPFIITHRHNHGSSAYIAWFTREPNNDEAAAILESEFESERGEELSIESSVTLGELTAVSDSSRL